MKSNRYKITVRKDFLHFEISGSCEKNNIINCFRKIFEASQKENRLKAFIDFRNVTGEIHQMDRYNIGEFIASEFKKHKTQIGLIGNEPLLDPNRLAEVVATNRGVLLKASTDIKEITKWLNIEL